MFNFFKKRRISEEKPKNLKLIALCLAFEVANADNDIDTREKDIIALINHKGSRNKVIISIS